MGKSSFDSTTPSMTTPISNYSTTSSSLGNEEQFYCGFTIHVASATLLIGSFGSLICSIILTLLFKANANLEICFITGIILCSYAFLVLGWSIRMPCLYLIFLLINPLVICLFGLFFTYPTLNYFLLTKNEENNFQQNNQKQQLLIRVKKYLNIMELIISIFAILIFGYFQSIVFRAYNWLKKRNQQEEQQLVYFREQNI